MRTKREREKEIELAGLEREGGRKKKVTLKEHKKMGFDGPKIKRGRLPSSMAAGQK